MKLYIQLFDIAFAQFVMPPVRFPQPMYSTVIPFHVPSKNSFEQSKQRENTDYERQSALYKDHQGLPHTLYAHIRQTQSAEDYHYQKNHTEKNKQPFVFYIYMFLTLKLSREQKPYSNIDKPHDEKPKRNIEMRIRTEKQIILHQKVDPVNYVLYGVSAHAAKRRVDIIGIKTKPQSPYAHGKYRY